MKYPSIDREPVVDHLHGVAVPDPYRRLEDPADPATVTWLAGQDAVWRALAATLPGRAHLTARLTDLSDTGLVTAPLWRGERRFHLRRAAGQEHAVLYVADPDAGERPVLDPTALDPTGLTTLDAWQPDLEGRLLAYQISRRGEERSELHVMDVATGERVDGPVDRCRYSPVAWLPGGRAFYYVRDAPRGVYLRRLPAGDSAAADVLILERDEVTSYGLETSQDGRWLAVSASPGLAPRNDLWLADLSAAPPERPELRVVQSGVAARTVVAVARDGRMYVATDLDAPTVKLCVGDPARPRDWKDLIPPDPEAVLSGFTLLDAPGRDHPVLLVTRIRHAVSETTVHDSRTGARLGDVPLPGPGSVGPLTSRPGTRTWFTYTDHVTPPSVWTYDTVTARTTPALPGGGGEVRGPAPAVERHRMECTSADGTRIRVLVIAPAGPRRPRPTILYGYGGFGVSLVPGYAADALAWVEAGGAVAIAMLRGGGEEGEEWHRAGMLERKQNVFDDFIAAAEKLVADGWTTTDRLGIWGESNGGLLVGAALTQRPDLFAAAVCCAPLLDMVRYERSGLGPSWRAEYGTVGDGDQFRALYGYSPYHRVRRGERYPATLFTVFGGDTRVDPAHARKMCAALQWATEGTGPIVLRHETDVGHGPRAASRSVALAADMLAFLAAHTGLDLPDIAP